jgi:hypothetical protein
VAGVPQDTIGALMNFESCSNRNRTMIHRFREKTDLFRPFSQLMRIPNGLKECVCSPVWLVTLVDQFYVNLTLVSRSLALDNSDRFFDEYLIRRIRLIDLIFSIDLMQKNINDLKFFKEKSELTLSKNRTDD